LPLVPARFVAALYSFWLEGWALGVRSSPKSRSQKAGPGHLGSTRHRGVALVRASHTNTRTKKMFAVIKTGGKQYRVAAEDVLRIDRLDGEPGTVVEFGEVLVVGGDTPVVGSPTVAGATVAGELLDQVRGRKVIAFKKRRRKNSRRKRGHRQEYSLVRITEILTEGRKPSPTPPPRPPRPARPQPERGAEASA
jgi:large subunit ribosomal protein L21